MRDFFSPKKMTKFSTVFLLSVVIVMISGCSDNTGATTPTSTISKTTAIQLLVSNSDMPSHATASTLLTAVALDASGQAMVGEVVKFKSTDGTAYFSNVSTLTDANGVANATLNIGKDLSNRVIPVSATVATVAGDNTVTVTGSKITFSGNAAISLNASAVLSITVTDSMGKPIANTAVTATSKNGNPVVFSPATGITDSAGQVVVTVTATNAGSGTDTITVSGAGDSKTQLLTINSAGFAFTAPTPVAPATTPEVLVNATTSTSVLWTNAGVPVANASVAFSTSRGTFSNGQVSLSAITSTTGVATATFSAASTGATKITASGIAASGSNPTAILDLIMVTNTPTTIDAQATPAIVAVNIPGTNTNNQAVISVVVRDSNNNLVKNAHVIFTQIADPSGGSLLAGEAITDITGTASVNYLAGTTSSPQKTVEIKATLDRVNNVLVTPNLTASVLFTVASENLFVRLGTGNKIFFDDPLGTYTENITALVTDSAGNPAPDGTEVRFVLRPVARPNPSFYKGDWHYNGAFWQPSVWNGTSWVSGYSASCINEDSNGDGRLQLGEDTNGNRKLDPVGVATVNATAKTVSGFALAQVKYAKVYAIWVDMTIEGRAGTIGNDPPAEFTFNLPILRADANDPKVPPPPSPYGTGTSCSDTL
jgi:Bacterial Ig-like domain (group 1)